MNKVICVWKKIGQTPLQVLDVLKETDEKLKEEKLSYAGRLDPMASGVMLILVGSENKKRDKYLHLDKEYEVEVLFGIKTDSYDVMGIPTVSKVDFNHEVMIKTLTDLKGPIIQTYPPYSGKTIKGIKMFELAKANKLPDELPKIDGEIYSIEIQGRRIITFSELLLETINRIDGVIGDFRQKQIKKSWKKLKLDKDEKFKVVNIKISGSSGLFMRSIANDLGEDMGGGALALNITRTRVGSYSISDCIKI